MCVRTLVHLSAALVAKVGNVAEVAKAGNVAEVAKAASARLPSLIGSSFFLCCHLFLVLYVSRFVALSQVDMQLPDSRVCMAFVHEAFFQGMPFFESDTCCSQPSGGASESVEKAKRLLRMQQWPCRGLLKFGLRCGKQGFT